MYSDEAQIFVFSKALGKYCKILGGMEIKACISLNMKHIDKDMYKGIRREYDMA
jgi:hypothetical protein